MDAMEVKTSLSIIEDINITRAKEVMEKIKVFQSTVNKEFRQNHDYGIIPGTGTKPTLLKPGAEKILMLMGLSSEFQIIDSTRDFESGFFQYQIKCVLKKYGEVITEGMGGANTKEKKFIKQDPYTMDNTVLKMAKKRALVDAALLVGSLSDIFTQDVEDITLDGDKASNQQKVYTDNDGTISQAQAKRMYALAGGDKDIINEIMKGYSYKNSLEIKKVDYEDICNAIKGLAELKNEGVK